MRRELARLAAAVAAGGEPAVEAVARGLAGRLSRRSLEETVLQTYLFAGFPAAINGFIALERVWPPAGRTELPGVDTGGSWQTDPRGARPDGADPEPGDDGQEAERGTWRARGERLCARVYGPDYERLRRRMRELSPALDEWAVVEGYGKTLTRPGLDEATRELCAVAALAAVGAARQLRAHIRGARRLGLDDALIAETAREAIRRHAPPARRAELEALLEGEGSFGTDLEGQAAPVEPGAHGGEVRPPVAEGR